MADCEKGHLKLQVDVSQLFWKQWTSEPVIIHQLPWIIRVNPEWDDERDGVIDDGNGGKHYYLSCRVICNSESPDTRWICVASVVLRVRAQNELLVKSEWKHTFNSQENSCACNCVLTTTTTATTTMPPNSQSNPRDRGSRSRDRRIQLSHRRYNLATTDTITVEADVKIEAPYVPKTLASLADRMAYLLSSEKDSNVRFLVGDGECGKEKFSAHKGILATLSYVFDRMFDFDSQCGTSDKVIEITDVKPEAFRVMLNFIYTTNLGGLNQENVFDVLHAAKKYDISDLIDACADCPKLDVDKVLYALGKAIYYDVKSLIDRCWEFVDKNACAVLENDNFLEISQALLSHLFARDHLVLYKGEIAIWNAAIRWADAQCHKRNMEATGDNRRKILSPALYNIRFPLIPKDKFASIIVPTEIMTNEEIVSVLLYHVHPEKGVPSQYPLGFSCKVRSSK